MSDKPYVHMFDISKCSAITKVVASMEIACPTTSVS